MVNDQTMGVFNICYQWIRTKQWLCGELTFLFIMGMFGIVSADSLDFVELVSVNKQGTDSGAFDTDSYRVGLVDISVDGRFVVFVSGAHNLVANDTNGKADVFVRDLEEKTTTLVSINKDGTDSGAGHSGISSVAISGDGRYVVFDSYANNLVAKDSNGILDVFIRDLHKGTTNLVSVNKYGTDSGSGSSGKHIGAKISTDGRFVFFGSRADNLVSKDTNRSWDLFVRDLQKGTTSLVTVNKDGTDSASYSAFGALFVDVSADGRLVVFASNADNLVDTDTNGMMDVFVRDIQEGTTTLISANKDGTDSADGESHHPQISADGRFVAFTSSADDLVASQDNNAHNDVFLHDLQGGITILISGNIDGSGTGNAPSYGPQISADGRIMAFQSHASDLVMKDTNGERDVFLHDTQSGATTLVSINKDGVYSETGGSESFELSTDGRFIAFQCVPDDLVATDGYDLFVRDLKRGITTPATVNKDGTDSKKGRFYNSSFAISGTGRFVAFTNAASDLVAKDSNSNEDVFVFDVFQATRSASVPVAMP
jgi:Tol biopolymer transport system component